MVTLKQFIQEPTFNILDLIAGNQGLDKAVSGLNVIESSELSRFCLPNELLICTGIQLSTSTDELLNFIKEIAYHRCAGLIINIGPYISSIPKEAIDLANDLNFPLFQMAWQHRIVDLLRTSFQFFLNQDTEELTTQELLESVIFKGNKLTDPSLFYRQTNFEEAQEFGIIVCTTKQDTSISKLEPIFHQHFTERYDYFLTMRRQNQRIYLISRSHISTPDIPFARTIQKIIKALAKEDLKLSIGMGNFYTNPLEIATSYDEALSVIKLSTLHSNPHLYKYKELGAYKILLAVNDKQLLQHFSKDMLGNILTYDSIHQSHLFDFLRIFIEEDGQTARISKREFIHRNTVLYKVKKIEMLLDVDLSSSFTKTNISLAFMIHDSLSIHSITPTQV